MDGRGKGAAMQIETLVKDIYNVLEEEHTVSQENIDLFVKGITDVIVRSVSSPRRENNTNLRMSSIGRKDRKLWLEANFPKEEALPDGPKLMKFLYGGIFPQSLKVIFIP